MALLGHPDWAMMTDSQGNRVTKPYVSGPSPISQGLMAAGFGMMGDGNSEWVGGGGFNWDALGRGGLLGLQAYQNANKNLQDQRSEFYNQRNALEDQLIQNQRFKNEQEEFSREKKLRQSMISGLPKLLETLEKTNIPGIQNRIQALMAQAQAGDIKGAYQVATNLNSQLAKVTKEKPEIITMDNGQKIMVQKDSGGGYSVIPGQSFGKSSGLGGNRGKAIELILRAEKGEDGLTLESPIVIAAHQELMQPRWVSEYDPKTGNFIDKPRPGYVPPYITKIMGGQKEQNNTGSAVTPKGIVRRKAVIPQGERQSAGYANRMQKAMYEMDELMAKGYRPSRIVMEYVKMGAPQSIIGRTEKEAYRAAMSPQDRQYARAVQDWLRAKLRKESGAVIGVDEAAEEVEAFFNVLSPGASTPPDEVWNTFRNSRITALESMIGESGPAWDRWEDLKFAKKPRSASDFYNNSPFQKKGLTKAEKIKKRFKKK